MRIPARIIPNGFTEIEGFVMCTKQQLGGPVTFLIDTASESSSMGEKDAESMGLKMSDLPRYTGPPIGGIGGKADTFVVEDVTIILAPGSNSETICTDIDLHYHKGKKYKKRKRKGIEIYDEEFIHRLPSIFGVNLMKKIGFSLFIDWNENEAYLAK